MKIRIGVDAARSRLGRLEIFDSAGNAGQAVDACVTADPAAARAAGNAALDPLRAAGPAPFGWYTLKEVHRVEDAARRDLGDKTVLFEPRTGQARRAESLGRLAFAQFRLVELFHEPLHVGDNRVVDREYVCRKKQNTNREC